VIQVSFGEIPIEAIEAYAKTEDPYIHSGGYELTGEAASFIKTLSGSMTAIQGLDVFGVCSKIVEGSKKLGWI
jgi:predicted house-cleaning NTP pyrophosphatase (Maf/HAM1 superfamily)